MAGRPLARPSLRGAALAAAAVVLGAGGCGYHLRGAADLPPELDVIHVDAPVEFSNALEIFLEGAGTEVVDDPARAAATIRVRGEDYARRVIAVDPDTGNEREFELVYTVDFSMRDRAGKTLVQPQQLKLRRDFILDDDAVLGTSREEDVLRIEMRRDAAELMVRRLEAALAR